MADSIRVLHVDDELDFADMVGTFLEREDERFDIVTVTSAADGMDRLSGDDTDIHCVVSDYDMPRKNGIEFLKAVRDQDDNLPFILYTGKGSEEVASDAISNGATDYLQKGFGTEQYELLANRIRNAVERYRSQHRSATLERVRTLVRDINQALVRASSRQEIETRVCDILTGADPYPFAVIADVDAETKRINPKTWAGTGDEFLEEFEMHVAEDAPGRQAPGGRAYHEREIAIAQNIQTDPTYEKWRDLALAHGFRSVAVVPLVHEETLYGLLAVLADRPHAFDDTEQSVLAELGDDIAHAIYAQSVRRELRQKERRYEAIFNDPNILVGLIDTDGTVRDINETAMAYIDAMREEVTGIPFWETPWFEHSEAVQGDIREWINRAASGEYVEFELDLERPDGEPYAVKGVFRPVMDDNGEVVSLIISDREVTDRKERERELERMRDFFTEAERLSNLGAWEFDATGDVVWSDGTRRIHEVDDSFEPTVEDGIAFYHPDDRDTIKQAVEEALEDGEPYDVEARLITANDNERWVQTRGEPIDTTTEQPEVRGYIQDVTDQKQREQDLEKAKSQLEAAVEAGNVATWEWHVTEDRLVTGPEFARTFGVDPDDARSGASIDRFLPSIHEDDRDRVEQQIQAALDTCGSYEAEYRVWNADGELRWVVARGHVKCDDEGNPVRFPGALTDITDRKQAEQELKRKNDRLDEFTSIVSHDLQTPLAVAEGHIELAQEECDSEHLADVDRALERMRALINDLLTLAREGETLEEITTVGLEEYAQACWGNVETAEATMLVDTDRSIRADERRLQQLFENLFRNAVEHGGPDVTVAVGGLDDGFYVEDTGPGIPDENREEVFNAGFSTAEDGTGFGLSIVKQVVEAHGWDIRVSESSEGGARFEVTGERLVE